jgi:hypothetical protein
MQLFFILLLALLAVALVRAQPGQAVDGGNGDQQEQKTITLNKDSVEALLQVLSPACRVEMATALSAQADISNECKVEIQGAIAELNAPLAQEPMTNKDRYESDRQQQQQQQRQEEASGGKAPNSSGPAADKNTIVLQIVSFVVLLFAAIGAYIYHVNSQLPASPRKASKKKNKQR